MNIRNFTIIAHIDHGKSTLADRMIEMTHTIEDRKMKEQVLDSMDLERERGITIKMQPVRMNYMVDGIPFVLNLIDTPGHIDFSYEVSRALKAVEGSLLLVDATQGVQAQTLTTLSMARELGLTIIPVLSKIDSPLARIDEVRQEMCQLLKCSPDDILLVSGRTGEGVDALLTEITKKIPPPHTSTIENDVSSLVFDFSYSNHRGVIVYIRVIEGRVKKGDTLIFHASKQKFIAGEVGIFSPEEQPVEYLSAGEIGYIVTGVKQPHIASVGDTVTKINSPLPALAGYMLPRPVVWASIYPESQDDFTLLRQSLERLKLSDSSLTFEEESSGSLGRGFRCGFLGMLHLEIITERLRREFDLELIVTSPSITYDVTLRGGKVQRVYSPVYFPDDGNIIDIREPWVNAKIITHRDYVGNIIQILYNFEAIIGESEILGENRTEMHIRMPLRELMRGFFDVLKSASSGYASLSYELDEMKKADVTRLDILVAEEIVPAFSRVVSKRTLDEEAKKDVEKLYAILPQQMITTKIQAKANGRIISSRSLTALKKDVTAHMYGGDITRKMKLREKQKKGKKKMQARGKVNIPHHVFLKMMRSDSQ